MLSGEALTHKEPKRFTTQGIARDRGKKAAYEDNSQDTKKIVVQRQMTELDNEKHGECRRLSATRGVESKRARAKANDQAEQRMGLGRGGLRNRVEVAGGKLL